jgi:hypothetical protein
VFDSKKQTFTNEKFLYSLSEQGLQDFCLLFEKLVEISSNHSSKYDLTNFQDGFLFALLNPNYSVRKTAQTVLKRLFKWISNSNNRLIHSFLNLFESSMHLFSAELNPKVGALEKSDLTGGTDTAKWPSNKGVCEALLTLSTSNVENRSDLDQISSKLVLLCNLKQAKEFDMNLYEKCLTKILNANKSAFNDLNSNDLIQSQTQTYIDLTLKSEILSEVIFDFSFKSNVHLTLKMFFLTDVIRHMMTVKFHKMQ